MKTYEYNIDTRRKNMLHTTKRRKANCIHHILHRNCLVKRVIEEKIQEREDEEADIRRREYTRIWKRKH
jgi:hypothetical protein